MTALARWRSALGWSQYRASRELGCSRNAYRGWEANDNPPHYIQLACRYLWEAHLYKTNCPV